MVSRESVPELVQQVMDGGAQGTYPLFVHSGARSACRHPQMVAETRLCHLRVSGGPSPQRKNRKSGRIGAISDSGSF